MCVTISIKIPEEQARKINFVHACRLMHTKSPSNSTLHILTTSCEIIHSYISLLKYHRKILRNLAGSPSTESLLSQTPPFDRGTSPNNSFDCQLQSDSHAKLFNAISFAKLKRSSNSQKSPQIPPQIDIVSEFNLRIRGPKSIHFEALSLQLKFKFGKNI